MKTPARVLLVVLFILCCAGLAMAADPVYNPAGTIAAAAFRGVPWGAKLKDNKHFLVVTPNDLMLEKAEALAAKSDRKVKIDALRVPAVDTGPVYFAEDEAAGSGVKCVLIIGQGKEEAEELIRGATGLLGEPETTGDNTLKSYKWSKGSGQGFANMGTVDLGGQFHFNFILVPGGK